MVMASVRRIAHVRRPGVGRRSGNRQGRHRSRIQPHRRRRRFRQFLSVRLQWGRCFSTPQTPHSRGNIRERQAAGIAAPKERGVYSGRQGRTTKAKPLRAAELRAKGLTDSEVAEALGVSRRTVQRLL
ncbi:MAG: hypothetical protein GY903_27915 [Fuerstiella sp.]|nr:hypothetical protein [Fuerstiella sp.]